MRITRENRDRNGHVLVWNQPGLDTFQKQQKPACKFINLNYVYKIINSRTRVSLRKR